MYLGYKKDGFFFLPKGIWIHKEYVPYNLNIEELNFNLSDNRRVYLVYEITSTGHKIIDLVDNWDALKNYSHCYVFTTKIHKKTKRNTVVKL